MANVNIKFNNKDYLLSCDDGQEEDLKTLTRFLDKKYSALKDKLGNIGENKLLQITSIQVIDEYFDLKKRVQSQKENFFLSGPLESIYWTFELFSVFFIISSRDWVVFSSIFS